MKLPFVFTIRLRKLVSACLVLEFAPELFCDLILFFRFKKLCLKDIQFSFFLLWNSKNANRFVFNILLSYNLEVFLDSTEYILWKKKKKKIKILSYRNIVRRRWTHAHLKPFIGLFDVLPEYCVSSYSL